MRRLRGMSRKTRQWLALLLALVLLVYPLAFAGCTASTRGIASQVQVEEELPGTSAVPQAIIDPLNGQEVDSMALISRRPLAVKVENDPAARPQSGLVDAEMVIEELVEGGVTRFVCFFLANESKALGPNRSVRPSDIDITYFLQPLLICSGGAPQVMAMVRQSKLMFLEEDGTHFWRDRSRVAPHNLYTSTERLRAYLAEQGDPFNQPTVSGLIFRTQAEMQAAQAPLEEAQEEVKPTTGTLEFEANEIGIVYGAGCDAAYSYDPATNLYPRFVQRKPHTDKTTGAQVSPRNVIVQYVELSSSGVRDVLGSETPNLEVIGAGKCLVFSGGMVYGGTWKKADRNAPTRYYYPDGSEILLYPGQTWIHLIPETVPITVG